MKRILLFTLLTFAGSYTYAQGQIGNGDMESWANNDEPDNWNSFLTASGSVSGVAADQCDESSDVRPGSTGVKSCKIWSRSIVGVVANGNVTLGQINMGSIVASSPENHNYSVTADSDFSEAMTDTPDSIVFWAKFTPDSGSGNARMSTILHDSYDYKDPEDGSSAPHVVAKAQVNFPNTNGEWVRFSVPFNYSGPAMNNTHILTTFTTNEAPGGGSGGDELLIDDVELIYNTDTNGLDENDNDGIVVSMNNYTNTINFNSVSELIGEYTVYNTLGQAIQDGNVSNEVDFDSKAGVYFVHLNANNKFYTFEILKH